MAGSILVLRTYRVDSVRAKPRFPRANRSRPAPSHRAIPSGPNILLIVTDDQREGLQVMPNTRRIFEAGGTRFTNGFVSDPLCCPSRASIFTGRYPHNHHVRTQKQARNLDQSSTIQHYLQRFGYRTGIFGKYLNSWNLTRPPPYFDRWATFRLSGSAYRDGRWNVNGKIQKVPSYSTNYISRMARSFLRESAAETARPWFLYLAPAAPHFPYTPARRYARAAVPGWTGDAGTREWNTFNKPPFLQNRKAISLARAMAIRRQQFRTLMSVDDMVGSIFRQLHRLHETSNTLAFYISDNGLLWGEHRLRGKELPYTESIRVPFLSRWPHHIASGRVDNRLVSNVDIAPTIMRAAGLDPQPRFPMDGRSLLDRSSRKTVLSEYFRATASSNLPSWASLRAHRYQYTEYYKGARVVFRELYNLSNDPAELRNVIGSGNYGGINLSRMASLLQRARTCSGTACP
jgi:arylsulfatase A-like enzyme